MVTPFIPAPTRASALSVEKKVLTALRLYGFGSYQEITGTNVFTAVSQPSVSRAVHEVTDALIRPEIINQWVRFPRNLDEMRNLRTKFYNKYHLPGIVGCIDCTHVAIVSPRGDPEHPEHIYVNRKGYHSINVQLVCDESVKILHVNSKFPGSSHDAHIWRESDVSNTMEAIYRRNPNDPFFLLGDSGYPLRPWLMTPLNEVPEPGTPAERFNNSLKSARSTIERCNGVLKNRFRCLIKDRVLHYHPIMAANIVKACAVLHNMCLHANIAEPPRVENIDFDGLFVPEQRYQELARINPDLAQARMLQNSIIQNHFA